MNNCMVCERIDLIKQGQNPYFVRELNTGYVVIGDHQRINGYTLFLCKVHATELHFLEPDYKVEFLKEMSIVAEAVYNAFKPDKLRVILYKLTIDNIIDRWIDVVEKYNLYELDAEFSKDIKDILQYSNSTNKRQLKMVVNRLLLFN